MKAWRAQLEVRRITRSPVLVFRKDELVIGWGEDADIAVLTADDRHALLRIDDDGAAWVTPVSERGVWIDGQRIAGPARLAVDAELTVAANRLEVGEASVALAATPARSPAAHSRWQVEIVQREASPPEVRTFDRSRIVIGAGAAADLQLAGEDVSAPHCELRIDDAGRVEVADLGSQLGTCVNGRGVEGAAPLAVGDELGVAEYVIRLLAAPQPVATAAWRLSFEITERGGATRALVLDRDQVSIGRIQAGNDIVLPKGNVSKRHCRVAVRPDGTAVAVDGSSTNGTYLNGRKLMGPTPMRPGDKLYVGDFVIALSREPERVA